MRAASGSLTLPVDEKSEGSTPLAFPLRGHDPGVDTTFVFDLNETLLDASIMDEHFEAAFGDARVRKEWFAELLGRALLCNAVNEYRPFPELAAAAFDAIAARYAKAADNEREAILHKLAHMSVHSDVPAAIAYLANAGARLAVLTNSPRERAEAALERSGLRDRFEHVLSVETVRRFKPDRRVYEMAAAALHEVPSRLWLISAHWWDCLGAARLGWKTAFLKREGSHNDERMVRPLLQADSLLTLAHELAPLTVSASRES